jgi:hypothetical protein
MPRLAYLALIYASMGAAVAGLFLPLLPTTPFVLLACWAAAKGSPRWHNWILTHRRLGPVVTAWREQAAVPNNTKWLASAMLLGSWLLLLFTGPHHVLLLLLTLLFVGIVVFLWSRPVPTHRIEGNSVYE